jgi:Protein of unknown function (DUF2808)
MRPSLVSTVTCFALALTTIAAPQAQSQPTAAGSTLPYIYSNYTFPSYRATVARHTLRLAIPANSQPVSALKLTAPAGFKLDRRVEVFDNKTGVRLPVNVKIVGGAAPVEHRQTVELSFDRAVNPGTAIDLELNYVGIWGLERYYDLAAKFVGSDRYIDLGKTDLRRS